MFKLGIKNFRGFLDNEFAFSRVNILIGENSAGKSSLLKFLLALKQSLRVPNSRDYNLTLAGEEVDLGNYEEVIYNHEVERNLSFSFEVGNSFEDFFLEYFLQSNEISNILKNYFEEAKKEGMGKTVIKIDMDNELNKKITIENPLIGLMEIIPNSNKNVHIIEGNKTTCNIRFENYSNNSPIYVENIEYEQSGFFMIINHKKIKEKLSEDDFNDLVFLLSFFIWAMVYFYAQFLSVQYLNNPDFEAAKRLYFKRDKKMNGSVKNIEELIYLLGGDGFLQGNELDIFFQDYISKVQAFGIADNLYLKKIDSIRELRVVVNGIDSNITDVGFGVSLQLPIIAQAMLAEKSEMKVEGQNMKKGKLLLIEQPEIHLHPSLQAKFMDSLLQIGDNNMYFIETHSEHIVRKLQVLVKEGKYGLKPEDVCIHYFRKENGHIVTTLHTIDQATGKLSPKFPSGFYDVSTNLAYELIS